jgi:hypothetical protein
MKKFDIFFTIQGPGGTVTVPNNSNPVEATSMCAVLERLAETLPQPYGCETIAIRVEEVR